MYKIGDKVETPLGVGIITEKRVAMRNSDIIYGVAVKGIFVNFRSKQIKPYSTPHEKLIEMGYEFRDDGERHVFNHTEKPNIYFYFDGTASCVEITKDIALIVAQYLEELEGKE